MTRRALLKSCAAGILAAGENERSEAGQSPYPYISMTILWRPRTSNRTGAAGGAWVRVLDGAGQVVQKGYADADGKILFQSLPKGKSVWVVSTYRGDTQRIGPIQNNPADRHHRSILHVL